MSIGIRHYLFSDSGPVRLSDRVVKGMALGEDSLPQFASTTQRVLTVILELEDSEPVSISRTEGSVWYFDKHGDITEGLREALFLVMEAANLGLTERPGSKVVSLDRKLKRKKLFDKHLWEPTPDQVEVVARDIWPKGKSDRLPLLQGTAKRKPPLTWEAEKAINTCASELHKLTWAVSELKEPSLKGFEFEARRRAASNDQPHLYHALAEMAAEQIAIEKRKRTNKGVWYASVDIVQWRDRTGETVKSFHRRCESRSEAETAAQEMLAENAKSFSLNTTIEASIVTDLEWDRDWRGQEDKPAL